MKVLLEALEADFGRHERVRQLLLNRTHVTADDDDADALMVRVFEAYYRAVDGRPNTKGGQYHINLLPTTCHVYFGSVTGATPDGREAGRPLSEGISPVQGADRKGPTAVIKSVAKMDHVRTGGTLLNQKLTPRLLADDARLENFVRLVRSYFTLDGHHIQFNVVVQRRCTRRKQIEGMPRPHRTVAVYATLLRPEPSAQDGIIAHGTRGLLGRSSSAYLEGGALAVLSLGLQRTPVCAAQRNWPAKAAGSERM